MSLTVLRSVTPVPWSNWAEWKEVYTNLLSPEIPRKKWAVRQIAVWRSRATEQLPLYVELTATIVNLVLHDSLYTQGEGGCYDPLALQGAYALAIVRFINGSVDTYTVEEVRENGVAFKVGVDGVTRT